MTDLIKLSSNYIVQSRSAYQLEKFVIGQHDTAEMRYRQILIEAQDLIYKIKLGEINLAKTKLEIDQLTKNGTELSLLEAAEKQLHYDYGLIVLQGSKKELEILKALFDKYEKYTPEEIEQNQAEYWAKRLGRQAEIDRAAASTGISSGNLASLINAGIVSEGGENALSTMATELD